MSKNGWGGPPLLAILPPQWPAPLSSKWARAPRAVGEEGERVLDTYEGSQTASLKIQDAAESKNSRSEEPQYESVVAVNLGKYKCILVGADSAVKAQAGLVVLIRESYVVIRPGVEA